MRNLDINELIDSIVNLGAQKCVVILIFDTRSTEIWLRGERGGWHGSQYVDKYNLISKLPVSELNNGAIGKLYVLSAVAW